MRGVCFSLSLETCVLFKKAVLSTGVGKKPHVAGQLSRGARFRPNTTLGDRCQRQPSGARSAATRGAGEVGSVSRQDDVFTRLFLHPVLEIFL